MTLGNIITLITDITQVSLKEGLELQTAADTLVLYSEAQVLLIERVMELEMENEHLKQEIALHKNGS
jgi:hypothetical protein